jgi:hypothetical protein
MARSSARDKSGGTLDVKGTARKKKGHVKTFSSRDGTQRGGNW